MSTVTPAGATIPGVTHHLASINGTELHYVSAGASGSPILLVHGWPETWWAFRKLIPLLAATHQVFAVDLRGFGDSSTAHTTHDETVAAEDLHGLISHLGVGAVHLLCQDISGGTAFRVAATYPEDVASFIAVETALIGYGLEALADVNASGSWHVGFLGAPGIPSMLLPGHERELLAEWAYPLMTAKPGSISDSDIDEFVRSYSRPNGWRGTEGLYQALFSDNGATKTLAEKHPITAPVLTVESAGHTLTENTFHQIATSEITSKHLDGVGHLIAQDDPQQLAAAILNFTKEIHTQ